MILPVFSAHSDFCHCAVAPNDDLNTRLSASELAARRWIIVASTTPMVSTPSPVVDTLAAKLLSYSRDGLGVRLSALASS